MNLSRARDRHRELSDHQFARLKEESLDASIPATPKLIMQAAGNPHVSHNALENEWYTPEPIITAARAVMGSIDLDPASSAKANETVQAARYYSIEDDGLNKEWAGKVWLNPPYAARLIPAFINKLSTSNVAQAIVLTNNATETQWGAELLGIGNCICFPTGRVRFLDPHGNPSAPLQGQMIVGVHVDQPLFSKHFSSFGPILRR